jgi:hypothetical protein
MYGDTGATAHESFGGVFVRRSAPGRGAPWSHRAKVLLWTGLAVAGWAAFILAGYSVWSVL